MKLLKEIWTNDTWLGRWLLIVSLLTLTLTLAVLHQDVKEWEEFSKAHSCKIVGRTSGDSQVAVGPGITRSGTVGVVIVTTYTSDKTGWLCDDGITYWR